jgi:hypothetical protein
MTQKNEGPGGDAGSLEQKRSQAEVLFDTPDRRNNQSPRPPDLQELVARFGAYNRITPEAWVEWDRAVADYHVRRRDLLAREREESRRVKTR